VGWKRWNPNAILFEGGRSYGTPSWHVQALFGANRGDINLPVALTAPVVESRTQRGGMVGVGTWLTQAEYKDIKVTQGDKVLFASNFAKDSKGWKFHGGDWKTVDGALRQSSDEQGVRALVGKKEWKDYTLTLKARKLGGKEGFLILFAAPNEKDKAWWNLGGWGNKEHGVELRGVGHDHVAGKIETGRWYDIKVELQGPRIRCYLDGQLVHDITGGAKINSLYAVAGLQQNTREIILKAVNVGEEPLDTMVTLAGAKKLARAAQTLTLTSGSTDDENSFDAPTKIAPKAGTVDIAGPAFHYIFPPRSLTILRLKQTD
jgi:alpha-L-arabinofuranosidase